MKLADYRSKSICQFLPALLPHPINKTLFPSLCHLFDRSTLSLISKLSKNIEEQSNSVITNVRLQTQLKDNWLCNPALQCALLVAKKMLPETGVDEKILSCFSDFFWTNGFTGPIQTLENIAHRYMNRLYLATKTRLTSILCSRYLKVKLGS